MGIEGLSQIIWLSTRKIYLLASHVMKEVIMKKMQTYVLCSLSAHTIQYLNTFTPLLYTYYVPGIPAQTVL